MRGDPISVIGPSLLPDQLRTLVQETGNPAAKPVLKFEGERRYAQPVEMARARPYIGTMRPTPDRPTTNKESVWSFPRPAIAEPTGAHIRIEHLGQIVADTRAAIRTLETSHPPSYYIPRSDIAEGLLRPAPGGSFCEWKGNATYWDVVIGDIVLSRVGWSYTAPTRAFASLRDHVAFYAAPFDRCTVDGEQVLPQPGGFYGGWITSGFAGPFKGVPGSQGW